MDAGELGPERRLYYRELIARFAHHLGFYWNVGEENDNTPAQRQGLRAVHLRRPTPTSTSSSFTTSGAGSVSTGR